jgi:hypothetical protein
MKLKLNEEKLAHLFTTWDARYRENPEKHMSDVEHLLHNTPYSYGVASARYFKELYEEFYK